MTQERRKTQSRHDGRTERTVWQGSNCLNKAKLNDVPTSFYSQTVIALME